MIDLMLACAILICTMESGHSAFIEVQQNNKATLTLISEDGIHMTTRLQYADGSVEWVGFRSRYTTPIGPGEIDLRDHSDKIRVYVLLPVNSDQMKTARDEVVADFKGSTYRLNNNNCVFFAAEISKKCGYDLKDAFDVGKTPEEVVRLFAEKFRDRAIFDVRPFPWAQTKQPIVEGQYCVTLDWLKCHKPETVFGDDKVYVRAYVDNCLVFESEQRKSMGRGDCSNVNMALATLSAGQSIAVQLWDDDGADRDDLIFDCSLPITTAETQKFKQTRGVVALASESKYEVQLTVSPVITEMPNRQ